MKSEGALLNSPDICNFPPFLLPINKKTAPKASRGVIHMPWFITVRVATCISFITRSKHTNTCNDQRQNQTSYRRRSAAVILTREEKVYVPSVKTSAVNAIRLKEGSTNRTGLAAFCILENYRCKCKKKKKKTAKNPLKYFWFLTKYSFFLDEMQEKSSILRHLEPQDGASLSRTGFA